MAKSHIGNVFIGSLTAEGCGWRSINVGTSTSGGALSTLQAAEVALTRCTFADIYSPRSPAVQLLDLRAAAFDTVLDGCTWSNVSGRALVLDRPAGRVLLRDSAFTGGRGGAALNVFSCVMATSDVSLRNVSFSDNDNGPNSQGGALVVDKCEIDVRESLFTGNTATLGGAATVSGGSTVTFRDSSFIANSALPTTARDGIGGAVYGDETANSLAFDNCTMIANTANGQRPFGGAVAVYGGFLVVKGGSFVRNAARGNASRGSGGGLFVDRTRTTISGTTFFANAAVYSGGAVHAAFSPLVMRDSVVLQNSASVGGGVFLFEADFDLPSASAFSPPPPPVMVVASPAPPPAAAASPPPPLGASPSLPPPSPPPPTERRRLRSLLQADADVPATVSFPPPASPPPPPPPTNPAPATVMYTYYSLITNTSFTKNKCTDSMGMGMGGALAAARQDGPRWRLGVQLSTFVGNACPSGGALAAELLDSIHVVRSTFRANRAVNSGGAISLRPTPSGLVGYALVQENTFVNNRADNLGGAMQAGQGWSLEVNLNAFTGNGQSEDVDGGAVYVEYCRNVPGSPPTNPNVFLRINTFERNTART
ncbi:hypothetical protein GPECTOR_24g238 [Gonium pectorale]|uniref:Right handed beta helix domain-containing protein n=1 Tax=Gonium pectorale TaxID=33097 RepID=A0A150GGJ0_GONPE|nr:hypothetical protein GPECTOR_24g238 [Gonium pectorale]|eukprot:KXZ48948.1 hypothetical protein GPECTOR_24g238 [Gonium pectorale]